MVNYIYLRNKVWETLIYSEIGFLPISTTQIARASNVRVLAYSPAIQPPKPEIAGHVEWTDDGWTIFCNLSQPRGRVRFTIAHELGHIILGHAAESFYHQSSYNLGDIDPAPRSNEERDADMFAARLLAPACVLWGLNLHAANEIAAVTGLSYQAAQYRADRMAILYKLNMWLKHPLERQVYQQFLPWIDSFRL